MCKNNPMKRVNNDIFHCEIMFLQVVSWLYANCLLTIIFSLFSTCACKIYFDNEYIIIQHVICILLIYINFFPC